MAALDDTVGETDAAIATGWTAEMAFDSLPPQSPINPRADAYAAKALALSKAVAANSRCVLDVPYGDDFWQKIDIYLPDDPDATGLPVFLNLHGGGWTHGHKEWLGFMAPPIVSLPAVYISVSYRLAPDHLYPVPLEDTFLALKWTVDHIADHGGDPARVFIGGHSAGAHLSSLATLRRDMAADFGLPDGLIKGCFPVSGVYRIDFDDPELREWCEGPGSVLLRSRDDAWEASPIAHVEGNRTPFYVTWADGDGIYATVTGPRMVDALSRQPGRVDWHVVKNKNHFSINLDMARSGNPCIRTLRDWMAAS